jgi:hypothetical protein
MHFCVFTEIRFAFSINGLSMKWKTSSISVGAKITHTKIKHMPPERKPPKYPDVKISQFTVINLMSQIWFLLYYKDLDKEGTNQCNLIERIRYGRNCILFCNMGFNVERNIKH